MPSLDDDDDSLIVIFRYNRIVRWAAIARKELHILTVSSRGHLHIYNGLLQNLGKDVAWCYTDAEMMVWAEVYKVAPITLSCISERICMQQVGRQQDKPAADDLGLRGE